MPSRNQRRMEAREIERALSIDRTTYPDRLTCAVCGSMWMEHMGELCPTRDSGYWLRSKMVLEGKLPPEAIAFKPRGTFFLPLIEAEAARSLDLC